MSVLEQDLIEFINSSGYSKMKKELYTLSKTTGRKSYVYISGTLEMMRNNEYKIGKADWTKDIEKKANRFFDGKYQVLCEFYIEDLDPMFIESRVHQTLEKYRSERGSEQFYNIKYSVLKKVIAYTILQCQLPPKKYLDATFKYLSKAGNCDVRIYDYIDETEIITDLQKLDTLHDFLCPGVKLGLYILLGNTFSKDDIDKTVVKKINTICFEYRDDITKKMITTILKKCDIEYIDNMYKLKNKEFKKRTIKKISKSYLEKEKEEHVE